MILEVLTDGNAPFSGRDSRINPAFLAVQTQALRRPEILAPVVERLGLRQTFSLSSPEAAARLSRSLNIRRIDTGLIEVGVYDQDPRRAADIANTIAIVFKDRRLHDLQSNIDRRLAQLRVEVEAQRKRAEEARAEMDQVRDRDGIVDPAPNDSNAAIPTTTGPGDPRVYLECKVRYLQSARILEATQMKLATESLVVGGIDVVPVLIRVKAEPPTERAPFRFRRFW